MATEIVIDELILVEAVPNTTLYPLPTYEDRLVDEIMRSIDKKF